MEAYEFANFNPDRKCMSLVQSKYACEDVAQKIIRTFSAKGKDYRKEKDYKESSRVFIELTMSCDEFECISWMEHWMATAMAYGIQTKNLDWQTKFMAAWNIWCGIVK